MQEKPARSCMEARQFVLQPFHQLAKRYTTQEPRLGASQLKGGDWGIDAFLTQAGCRREKERVMGFSK